MIDDFTKREREIYYLVCEYGLTRKEIEKMLHISDCTCAAHLRHIRQKLGADKNTSLLKIAVRYWKRRFNLIPK